MLEVKALTKSFGALRATDNIDFEVREGELQKLVNEFHQAKIDEIMDGLRSRKQQ